MRLLFLNNAHPDTPHVSGMRLGCFARAMSKRGHQVVLLTGVPPIGKPHSLSADRIAEDISQHNWSEPFVLAVAPEKMWAVDAVRYGTVPTLLRRALTAWLFVVRGGVFPDWTQAASVAATKLVRVFQPDLVWATFGNTSNLSLAQGIAQRANCPWIMDIKDNWKAFVPAGLRHYMAWRFRDAVGTTANAKHHLDVAARWFPFKQSRVVYSGVSEAFFDGPSIAPIANKLEIMLIGSTYDANHLAVFIAALRDWLAHLQPDERSRIRFVYAGSDVARVRIAVAKIGLECETDLCGQLTVDDLARRVQRAFVNCYVWAPFGFHHKLLELLVAGRPVIVFPGEHAESLALVASCSTPFHLCETPMQLQDAIQKAWAMCHTELPSNRVAPQWRWDDLALGLDSFFVERVAKRGASCAE